MAESEYEIDPDDVPKLIHALEVARHAADHLEALVDEGLEIPGLLRARDDAFALAFMLHGMIAWIKANTEGEEEVEQPKHDG